MFGSVKKKDDDDEIFPTSFKKGENHLKRLLEFNVKEGPLLIIFSFLDFMFLMNKICYVSKNFHEISKRCLFFKKFGYLEIKKILFYIPPEKFFKENFSSESITYLAEKLQVYENLTLNSTGCLPIGYCSRRGYATLAKKLMEIGTDPSVENNYAIRLSSMYGHKDVVKLLVENKEVDLHVNDDECIKSALKNKYFDIFEIISSRFKIDNVKEKTINFIFKELLVSKKVDLFKKCYKRFQIHPNKLISLVFDINNKELLDYLLKDDKIDIPEWISSYESLTCSVPYKRESFYREWNLSLLKHIINLKDRGFCVDLEFGFKSSIKNTELKMVKFFVEEKKIDPSLDNDYAIKQITSSYTLYDGYRRRDVLKYLVNDKRVNLNVNNNEPWKNAITRRICGPTDGVLDLLLEDKRINPCLDNNFAIIDCIKNERFIIEILLKTKKIDFSINYEGIVREVIEYTNFSKRNTVKIKILKWLLKEEKLEFENYVYQKIFEFTIESIDFELLQICLQQEINITVENLCELVQNTFLYPDRSSYLSKEIEKMTLQLLRDERLEFSEKDSENIMKNISIDYLNVLKKDERFEHFFAKSESHQKRFGKKNCVIS